MRFAVASLAILALANGGCLTQVAQLTPLELVDSGAPASVPVPDGGASQVGNDSGATGCNLSLTPTSISFGDGGPCLRYGQYRQITITNIGPNECEVGVGLDYATSSANCGFKVPEIVDYPLYPVAATLDAGFYVSQIPFVIELCTPSGRAPYGKAGAFTCDYQVQGNGPAATVQVTGVCCGD
jgi:hypothetical protein